MPLLLPGMQAKANAIQRTRKFYKCGMKIVAKKLLVKFDYLTFQKFYQIFFNFITFSVNFLKKTLNKLSLLENWIILILNK